MALMTVTTYLLLLSKFKEDIFQTGAVYLESQHSPITRQSRNHVEHLPLRGFEGELERVVLHPRAQRGQSRQFALDALGQQVEGH